VCCAMEVGFWGRKAASCGVSLFFSDDEISWNLDA
jgi:hypothetical protein